MEKELFDYVAERAGILATADTSKQDTKDAAAAWKDAVAADSSDAAVEAATTKLLDFLEAVSYTHLASFPPAALLEVDEPLVPEAPASRLLDALWGSAASPPVPRVVVASPLVFTAGISLDSQLSPVT